jgi:hypothetical protein
MMDTNQLATIRKGALTRFPADSAFWSFVSYQAQALCYRLWNDERLDELFAAKCVEQWEWLNYFAPSEAMNDLRARIDDPAFNTEIRQRVGFERQLDVLFRRFKGHVVRTHRYRLADGTIVEPPRDVDWFHVLVTKFDHASMSATYPAEDFRPEANGLWCGILLTNHEEMRGQEVFLRTPNVPSDMMAHTGDVDTRMVDERVMPGYVPAEDIQYLALLDVLQLADRLPKPNDLSFDLADAEGWTALVPVEGKADRHHLVCAFDMVIAGTSLVTNAYRSDGFCERLADLEYGPVPKGPRAPAASPAGQNDLQTLR